MAMPRVASGRCRVGIVGMRLDARTKADEQLADWAAQHGFDYVGSLREAQAYVRSSELGLTLFDLPPAKVEADLAQWRPIVDWVHAAWAASERAEHAARAPMKPTERPIDVSPQARSSSVRARPVAPVMLDSAPSFGRRLADRLQSLVGSLVPGAGSARARSAWR
jgi:chromosome partitioning protein